MAKRGLAAEFDGRSLLTQESASTSGQSGRRTPRRGVRRNREYVHTAISEIQRPLPDIQVGQVVTGRSGLSVLALGAYAVQQSRIEEDRA